MNVDRVFNIAASLVVVAGITAVVSRPNSAKVFRSMGDAFSNSITAAIGRH